MDNDALLVFGMIALGAVIVMLYWLLHVYGKVRWVGYKIVRKASWYFVFKPFYVQQIEQFPEFTAIPLLDKLDSEEAQLAFIKFGFPGFTRWLVHQSATPMKIQVEIMCM